LGVLLSLVSEAPRFGESVGGIALGFASLFLFWQFGMIGGGDVKLTMMIGALKGWVFLLFFFFYVFALCLAGVLFLSFALLGIRKGLRFFLATLTSVVLFRPFPEPPAALQGIRVPFGLCSLIAMVVCLALQWDGRIVNPFS
jgi:Flp pilus assembly protein protease CpaA